MNLREQAQIDNREILEDNADGFGWPITVTDPAGTSAALTGFSGDIHLAMDPDTGQAVSGRVAHVSVPIEALTDAGLGLPQNVHDRTATPWRVAFTDTAGIVYQFKVTRSWPDRTLGMITCNLGAYTP